MTPQIMTSLREYHRTRQQTLNRYVNRPGIVHGLDVEEIAETRDGIEITVGAGLALDGRGRPIVVEQPTTKSLPDHSAETCYLYIQYDEVAVETVPVPDTDGAVSESAVPNRLVETFELTHRETPPASREKTPLIELRDIDHDSADAEAVIQEWAHRYHQQCRTGSPSGGDPAVYLGAFERTHDGSWTKAADAPMRSYVFDHEMLARFIGSHIADTDNPHETPIDESVDPQPDDIDALNRRVASVEERIQTLQSERDTFVEYALRTTVNDRKRYFKTLSDRLEAPAGEASRLARQIAQQSTDEFISDGQMESAYREQVVRLLDRYIQLGDALEQVVPEHSLEQYLIAVSELQSALETDAELLSLLKTDARVSEAADSLELLVTVIPDS